MGSKMELPTHFRDWNASSSPSDEPPPKSSTPSKPLYRRPWFIGVAIAAVVAIIIAIVVPLAVILPKQGKEKHDASVMLPLYVYPEDNSTWAPLWDALQAKPNLDFMVIINPSSGPGSSQFPDQQYEAALNQLSTYPNAQKVGYVRTGYASRNLSDVVSEVNTFAGWSSRSAALAMSGIFFDESPHQYSAEAVSFMREATRAVKNATGIQGGKTVVRNPGVIPDARFDDPNTDISVVFEQSYSEYQEKEADLSTLEDNRSHHCYMVHSQPDMDKGPLRNFVDDMSKRAEWLFVTSNNENYYESFGNDWAAFINAIPTS